MCLCWCFFFWGGGWLGQHPLFMERQPKTVHVFFPAGARSRGGGSTGWGSLHHAASNGSADKALMPRWKMGPKNPMEMDGWSLLKHLQIMGQNCRVQDFWSIKRIVNEEWLGAQNGSKNWPTVQRFVHKERCLYQLMTLSEIYGHQEMH